MVADVGTPVRALAAGVELAHVVADLVRTDLRELGPQSQPDARRSPGKRAGRAAREDEVEASTSAACIGPGPCDPGGDVS